MAIAEKRPTINSIKNGVDCLISVTSDHTNEKEEWHHRAGSVLLITAAFLHVSYFAKRVRPQFS